MMVSVNGKSPQVDPTAWIAPGAVLAGDVVVGQDASVFYTTVVRADADRIEIGARSNVQDGCVLHTDPGWVLSIGSGVSVGHRAVLHGCTIGDDVIIGMGSIVMNGAVIGAGSLVAAGSLVLEGTVVPPRSMVMGAPAKVRRELSEGELEMVRFNATHYVAQSKAHA